MECSYTIQALPSLKALLHAAKHPHSTVLGLLLGTIDGQQVTITDAIPLIHHWNHLSPMLEAGMTMAEIHAQNKKMRLIGTYVAYAKADEISLDLVAQRISQSIKTENPIALVIDNRKLKKSDLHPFIPFISSNANEWIDLNPRKLTAHVPVKWDRQPIDLGDFDDHLEDIGIDWLENPSAILPQ